MSSNDEMFMQEALRQARFGERKDEVPIGAIIVQEEKIIARAYNQVELLKDPTAHAEMLVITEATNYLGAKWLTDCTLYVTLEPCAMCAGALVLARIKRVVFGTPDPKTGACASIYRLGTDGRLNHRYELQGGLAAEACAELLTGFFEKKRALGKG